MDEVAGARERPGRTDIKVDTNDGATTVRLPAMGLGIPLIALGVLDIAGVITFIVALILFILERHSFFGVRDLLPTDNTPTQHWKWVIVAMWIGLIVFGSWVLLFIARIGYQTEAVRFDRNGVDWLRATIGRREERQLAYEDVLGFTLTHDPTGMRRSRLLLLGPNDAEY